MSILQYIFSAASNIRDPAEWLVHALGGQKTASGMRVNQHTAMTFAPYYAGLRAISEDVAKLPFKVFRRLQPRGKENITDHRVQKLIQVAPNRDMTSMAFRETVTHWALGWGGGLAEIQRSGAGVPVALWPIHPSRVQSMRNDEDGLFWRIASKDNRGNQSTTDLLDRDTLHIHGLSSDGVQGYSVLAMASESLGLGLAAQRFGAAFFGNGAHIGGVLEHPKTLSDTAHKRLRESWNDEYTGSNNTGKTLIAEEGMKYTKRGIPPDEAQFLETQQFSVETFARWFRIPPHKLQDLQRATFSNIEQQSIEYVNDTLMPWLIRWEQEVERKLFMPNAADRGLFARHVVQALLRGDQSARGEFYTKQLANGSMSPNDIRELEDQNPVDGGDDYFVPMNLRPLNQPVAAATTTISDDAAAARGETMKLAHSRIIVGIVERLTMKQCRATKNANRKFTQDAGKFDGWCENFFTVHTEQTIDALLPTVNAMVLLTTKPGGVPDFKAADRKLNRYINNTMAVCVEFLNKAFEVGRPANKLVNDLCDDWTVNLPADVATHLTELFIQNKENQNDQTI